MRRIVFIISVLIFSFSCSKEIPINENNSYEKALFFIESVNYHVNQDNFKQLSDGEIQYKLWFIFNETNDTCGTLLISNSDCKFALIFENNLHEYSLSIKNGECNITENQVKNSYSSEVRCDKLKSLNNAEYGVCQYVSQVGFSIGCWALPDNPLGYYHIITTKIGDPITAYHYQWCANWQGNAVSCPLNENTYNTFECGPPSL